MNRIDADALDAYVDSLRRALPGFSIRYKDESRLQRAIAVAVWPFNRRYLDGYTTVMFGNVYFPSRRWCDAVGPEQLYRILRHEAVHLRDARRWPGLFHLSYLFGAPAVFTARAFWEARAYAESLRVSMELDGDITDAELARIARAFTGPDYLYMCPFPRFVKRRLHRLREQLRRELASHDKVRP